MHIYIYTTHMYINIYIYTFVDTYIYIYAMCMQYIYIHRSQTTAKSCSSVWKNSIIFHLHPDNLHEKSEELSGNSLHHRRFRCKWSIQNREVFSMDDIYVDVWWCLMLMFHDCAWWCLMMTFFQHRCSVHECFATNLCLSQSEEAFCSPCFLVGLKFPPSFQSGQCRSVQTKLHWYSPVTDRPPWRQSFTGEVEHLKLPLRIKEPQSWTFPRTLGIVSPFSFIAFFGKYSFMKDTTTKQVIETCHYISGWHWSVPSKANFMFHTSSQHSILPQFRHEAPIPLYDRKTLWLHPSWNWSKTCVRHKDVFGWCLLALGSAHQQDIYPPSMSSNGPRALTSSRNQIAWEPMFAIHGVCGSS